MRDRKVMHRWLLSFMCFCYGGNIAFAQSTSIEGAIASEPESVSIQDGDVAVTWHPQAAVSKAAQGESHETSAASVPSETLQTVVVVVNTNEEQANASATDVIQTEHSNVVMPDMPTDRMLTDVDVEKDWQRGFEMRLSLAPSFMLWSEDHYSYTNAFFLGVEGGIELGYRWPKAGVYVLIAGSYGGVMGYGDDSIVNIDFTIMGRFFVPIRKDFEFMFGFGFGTTIHLELTTTAALGLHWHFGNAIVGAELIYQGAVMVDIQSSNDIRPTFVVGYTF